MKKLMFISISLLLLFSFFFNVIALEDYSYIETRFGDFSIEQDFILGEVLVWIDVKNSEINKPWTLADFPTIDVSDVVDYDDVPGGAVEMQMIDEEHFMQFLCIKLNDSDSKEAVLKAVYLLQEYDFVEIAIPNLILTWNTNDIIEDRISGMDLLALKRTILFGVPFEGKYLKNPDLNGDGKVNGLDLMILKKMLLG